MGITAGGTVIPATATCCDKATLSYLVLDSYSSYLFGVEWPRPQAVGIKLIEALAITMCCSGCRSPGKLGQIS